MIAATSGAIFANPKYFQEINNRVGDSAEAPTREGLTFANESKSAMAEAISQTKAIVERSTKLVTGDWDPDLAGKEQPEFAKAATEFAVVGELSEREDQVLELQGTFNRRVSELNRQIGSSTSSAIAAGSKKGEAITNEPGLPIPATLKQTSEGIAYNPGALTPSEQGARKNDEQKMADEILEMRASSKPSWLGAD